MYTVITKGNEVSKHNSIYSIERSAEGPFLAIDNGNGSKVAFTEDSPITWPTDATDGLQAIVDVKAGTLRFGYFDGWPRAHTEFVVSTYGDSGTVSAPHIFDLVESWPDQRNRETGLSAPEGWEWKYFGDDWCLSNGFVGLKYDDWFKYKLGDLKPAKSFGAVEDIDLPTPVTAASILTVALGHMEDRAKTYDAPGGERSMGKTVAVFNAITGLYLTEEQGWLFMEILKQVRSQQGDYRADNYEDMVAYAALRGECAARERGNQS